MFETIKGIIGDIASGAVKDQRIALSQEQLTALDSRLRDALEEVTRLQRRVSELEHLLSQRDAQLAQLTPTTSLEQATLDVLKFFFDESRDLSADDVAARFRMPIGVADYHVGLLAEGALIVLTVVGISGDFGEQRPAFAITSEGRKYVMQHRNA